MEIPAQLHCLFSAQVTEQNESYQITIPNHELQRGDLQSRETYRVALFSVSTGSQHVAPVTESEADPASSSPPVEAGERRDLEIETLGEQGDGIACVERGFVIIIPDTEPSERVTVEITDVKENVAFATVIERLGYYD